MGICKVWFVLCSLICNPSIQAWHVNPEFRYGLTISAHEILTRVMFRSGVPWWLINILNFSQLPAAMISDCSGYGVPWWSARCRNCCLICRPCAQFQELWSQSPLQQTTCALESCKNGFQSRSSGSAWVGAPRRTLGVPTEFHAESKVLTPLGAPFAFPCNSFNPICSCHSPRIPDQSILHFGTKHMPGICHTSTCYLNTLDIII